MSSRRKKETSIHDPIVVKGEHVGWGSRTYEIERPNGLTVSVEACEDYYADLEFKPVAAVRKKLPKTIGCKYLYRYEVVLARCPYDNKGRQKGQYRVFQRSLESDIKEPSFVFRNTRIYYSRHLYSAEEIFSDKYRYLGEWMPYEPHTPYSFYSRVYRLPYRKPNSQYEIIIPMPKKLLEKVLICKLDRRLARGG